MKRSHDSPPSRRQPTDPQRRAQLLAAFERSQLSAAAFARQHGLHYTTFCGWRYHHAKVKASPDFVQVELTAETTSNELVIELGSPPRFHLRTVAQIELAAYLLHRLNTFAAC